MPVEKWGNSLAVRLPQALVEELGLKEGDELVVIAARKGTIEVETREERRRRALDNMRARQWTPASDDKSDRAEFLRQVEAFRFPLPDGYKFDRDEANER